MVILFQQVTYTVQFQALAPIMHLVLELDVLLWEQWDGLKVITTIRALLLVQFLMRLGIFYNVGGSYFTLAFPKQK